MKNNSKIKKFYHHIKENKNEIQKLIYYSFDVDDNLLYLPANIYMEHLVNDSWIDEPVNTEMFAKVRKDKDNWRYKNGDESFVDFRDYNGNDTFLKQFKKAVINKKFGPSWNKFIECLVNGNIFAIITSRGHEPDNIKMAFEWLLYEYGLDKFKNLPIDNVDKYESLEDQMINNLLKYHQLFGTSPDFLIDQYLLSCPIYTVQSKTFIKTFGKMPVENAKKVALVDFNRIVQTYSKKLGVRANYGFSDDEPIFVKSALDQFIKLKNKYKNIKYSVFDTGNKEIKKINL